MPATRQIRKDITVNAPAAKVYEALTTAAGLDRWWTSSSASDPKPGGRLLLEFQFKNKEQNGKQDVTYIALDKNKRVTYEWDGGEAKPTTVTWTLTETAGATRVEMVHDGFSAAAASDALIERHDQPWAFFTQNLKTVLEGGKDMRADALGQIVNA